MAIEIPTFFRNRNSKRLFSVWHESEKAPSSTNIRVAIIYCHPIFEEKLWGHRVIVNFARQIVAAGISVLRFDYFGEGESEGLFDEASLVSREEDINAAVDYVRTIYAADAVYLLGLSLGGTMALKVAEKNAFVAGAVAWSPVLDGEKYIADVLRMNLSAQMVVHKKIIESREVLINKINSGETVNVEGYEIGNPLYWELVNTKITDFSNFVTKPALVMQISPSDRLEAQYTELAENNHGNLSFVKVKEQKFWLQQKVIYPVCNQLFKTTMDWVGSKAGIYIEDGR